LPVRPRKREKSLSTDFITSRRATERRKGSSKKKEGTRWFCVACPGVGKKGEKGIRVHPVQFFDLKGRGERTWRILQVHLKPGRKGEKGGETRVSSRWSKEGKGECMRSEKGREEIFVVTAPGAPSCNSGGGKKEKRGEESLRFSLFLAPPGRGRGKRWTMGKEKRGIRRCVLSSYVLAREKRKKRKSRKEFSSIIQLGESAIEGVRRSANLSIPRGERKKKEGR